MWKYDSPIGIMFIKRASNGCYVLVHDNQTYGYWPSPESLASNIYTHTTGYDRWDELDGMYYDEPSDLSEWKKI